jgi:hypothetical protein
MAPFFGEGRVVALQPGARLPPLDVLDLQESPDPTPLDRHAILVEFLGVAVSG